MSFEEDLADLAIGDNPTDWAWLWAGDRATCRSRLVIWKAYKVPSSSPVC